MRRLTLALLLATYLILSLIVALTLWRNGAGWGVGVSSLVGALGLCLASHGMIIRFLEMRDLRGEVEAVRDAHRILLDQVVGLDGRLTQVARAVEFDLTRGAELTDEVHLLEGLVQKMPTRRSFCASRRTICTQRNSSRLSMAVTRPAGSATARYSAGMITWPEASRRRE